MVLVTGAGRGIGRAPGGRRRPGRSRNEGAPAGPQTGRALGSRDREQVHV